MKQDNHTSPGPLNQVVGRMYHCNNCGWHGDKVAHCTAIIVGGQVAKDTIAMSVCPCCNGLFSTLKRVFPRETNPPNTTNEPPHAAPTKEAAS